MEPANQGISCYYCNEWFPVNTFKDHIILCAQMLEKCPELCNALVPRIKLRSHLADCRKQRLTLNDDGLPPSENRILILEQDVNGLRNVLNEEIKQNLHLITDLGGLRKRNQILDEWIHKVNNVLTSLKTCINDEFSLTSLKLKRCNEELIILSHQYKSVLEYMNTFATFVEQMMLWVAGDGSEQKELYPPMLQNENGLKNSTHRLETKMTQIQKYSVDFSQELKADLISTEIQKLENHMDERDMDLRLKIKCLEEAVNKISGDLHSKFIYFAKVNTKQTILNSEMENVQSLVRELEEKCRKMDDGMTTLDQLLNGTNQGLLDLEEQLSFQNKILPLQNTRGHLIWKIDNFSKKFNEAKKYNTCINSPLFSNKHYGYNLRLEVHLNGVGTWRGRNAIVSLNVCPGDYDNLLEWPCKLIAEIILRDQVDVLSESMDYVKSVVVKKKTDKCQPNQCIHIPHNILETRNFIRDDAIFFEIYVQKPKR